MGTQGRVKEQNMRTTTSDRDIAAVWREFKQSGDESLRNCLVENFLPIVRYNAERIGARRKAHDDGLWVRQALAVYAQRQRAA